MKIRPVGHRILVKPDKVEKTSKGGIIVQTETSLRLEQRAQVKATVLAVGPEAYKEFNSPWCKEGDRILYQRHAGMRIPDSDGNLSEDLILLNDLDVTGVVEEE